MPREAITGAAVRRVLSDYARQYRAHPWYALGAFLLPALGSVFVFFVPPLVIAQIVNTLAAGEHVSLSSTGGYIAAFGLLWLVGEGFWRFGMRFLIRLESYGLTALNKSAFEKLTEREYDFYTNNFVGSLTKKALAYGRGFETFTDTLAFNIITNILPLAFAVVILARYSPILPAVLLAALALVIAVTIPIIRRRSKLVALRHAASSKMSGALSDALTNILAVKSFAKEAEERTTYGLDVDTFVKRFKHAADYHNLRFEMAVAPLYVATNVLGLVASVYLVEHLGLKAGTLVIVFSYYALVTRVFWEVNRVYRNLESSVSEAAEYAELVLAPPAIRDREGARDFTPTSFEISFLGVNFKYSERADSELFLKDFNLRIKSGERVGLVGPSGGGKTTITKLLLRFIELESGAITIGGEEIKNMTQRSLRETISYVPQEPLLFHRSLRENIAYAKQDASLAEIQHAAKLAHADEFIRDLPQGYETLVGERGVKLSGGQRQRIAIARALLKNAPILVLDEATSSLDSESEKYIQEGLWELMKDKTAIVIAHRLSTIRHLDRILVLENGNIVEDGTHEKLIAEGGLYAKLWSHQSGDFLEE